MPPKQEKKSKKQQESEDFQEILSQLSKVTKPTGKQNNGKQTSAADKEKREIEKRHEEVALKKNEYEKLLERQQQQRQLQQLIQQMMSQRQQSSFLSAPKTDFTGETKSNASFDVAAGAMQGWRVHMEDAHVIDLNFQEKCGLFCVFDGHAGGKCSLLNKALIPVISKKHFSAEKNEINFMTVFEELDNTMRARGLKDDSGSTSVCVFVSPTHVTCASVGDSRAVLCRDGNAVDLSDDHKPENEKERLRIIAAGGHVENNRVNGQLAMSRAMGDFQYKQNADLPAHEQQVIAVPDIVSYPRLASDSFVVVACDGIFDVLSNQELVQFIDAEIKRDPAQPLESICEKVCYRCLAPPGAPGQPSRGEGTDNMTIVIARFL